MENDTTLTLEPENSPQPQSDRITRWILTAIGVYTGLLVTLLNIIVAFLKAGCETRFRV